MTSLNSCKITCVARLYSRENGCILWDQQYISPMYMNLHLFRCLVHLISATKNKDVHPCRSSVYAKRWQSVNAYRWQSVNVSQRHQYESQSLVGKLLRTFAQHACSCDFLLFITTRTIPDCESAFAYFDDDYLLRCISCHASKKCCSRVDRQPLWLSCRYW